MTRRSVWTSAAALLLLGPLTTGTLDAQQAAGRITGRVIDASTGRGLSNAGIQVVGTTLGTQSRIDGNFDIARIPSGTVSLHVRLLGYQPKTVTGIVLPAGAVIEQMISLDVATVQLAAVEVTAATERGTVSEALDRQRTASNIVNAVTAEQIARSPDSDAAAAVQRVSGVSVQDGRYVFVRGLGERYTTTSLNGSRIPSPEPERKVVPLDLFPTGLLQSVTTSKTFTPDQPGDFSGAQVDLETREFPGRRLVTYSTSLGYNDRATAQSVFAAPRAGLDWLAFGVDRRALPAPVANAGSFVPAPTQEAYNTMVRSFRNAWTADSHSGAPNSSVALSVGGSDPIFGRRFGYIGSFTYSHSQEIRSNEVRAYAVPVTTPDGVGTAEVDRYDGETGRASVLWGGLLNLSTLLGTHSRLSLNNTYSRSADNEARVESGLDENTAFPFEIQRLRYVERSVWSSQLAGEHQFGDRHRVDWSGTYARVKRDEPDRSELVYATDPQGGTPFLFGGSEGAVRTFADLREQSINGAGSYALRFGEPGREHLLKLGGLARYTERDANASSYAILANLSREDRERAPEEIFGGAFVAPGSSVFRLTPLTQGGSYRAEEVIAAGFAMVEYQLGDRLRFIGGARLERWVLGVSARETFGGRSIPIAKEATDVLPSAAFTFRLTPSQNLRVSVSQTLARPEYREVVPINQRDVIAGEQFRGNENLKRTLIRNADVRWEWYPASGEVLSVALFAKQFVDPIERIYRGTSGTRVTTFENAESADNYGVEVEARKGLGFLSPALQPFSLFANATVMESKIEVGALGAGSTDDSRAMVGQAPYVVNAGLTYADESGRTSVTALYNVVGRRIYSASLLPLPNVYEEARNVLDLSLRFPVFRGVSGKLDARNVLDEPYEVTQGTVTRESYRSGRVFTAGLTWRR
jgi:hypothetical protein